MVANEEFQDKLNDKGYEDKLNRLRELHKYFPTKSGVYIMRDKTTKVIYIGKAKNLKRRVDSYLRGGDGRQQIPFLMRRVETIETIVTDNEQQAFVLERDLIAKYKPKYNVKLKDDKAYLSIRIDENQAWPRLELVRKIEPDGAHYFGPYSFSYELRQMLEIINRLVPLRSCTNTVFYNRQRPCLEYQIKRCSAPCCLDVDRKLYANWVKEAVAILDGKTNEVKQALNERMEKAASELRFEDAANIRDRIELLKNFRLGGRYITSNGENRDIWGLYREDCLAVISLMKVRNGRILDNTNFALTDVEIDNFEVLSTALSQYYDGQHELVSEIILPFEFEELGLIIDEIKEKYQEKTEFFFPKTGIRKRLLSLAELNARQFFVTSFEAESRYQEAAMELARLVGLKQLPRRIECVDISNLQASDIVGALVAFSDGKPDKKNYKKYVMSKQDKPDDFASVYEVMTRRFKQAEENEVDALPDLFIIDGGRGQLGAALAARNDFGCVCDIISLAKDRPIKGVPLSHKPERLFLPDKEDSIALAPEEAVTMLVTRIRDEAHRHVIQFHRSRRAKRVFSSVLDNIAGIGVERKKRLISAFGGVNGLRSASVEELAEKGGLPLKLAKVLAEKLANKDN